MLSKHDALTFKVDDAHDQLFVRKQRPANLINHSTERVSKDQLKLPAIKSKLDKGG